MSGSYCKVIIVGNLGSDPDVRTTAAGHLVCTLSVASSESYTDKQGQRQEVTEWHRCVVWGKTAEFAQRYLSKGRKVLVEGSLRTRSYEDKDGVKRYTTEVNATKLEPMDSGKQGSQQDAGANDRGGGAGGASRGGGYGKQGQGAGGAPPGDGPPPGGFDDDVPF